MAQFEVRPALPDDAWGMADLFAAVAEERTGIATEPPVNVSERAALFAGSASESLVAVANGQVIGMLHIEVSRHGFGELGMLVERGWRGRGVGSALVAGAIDWAHDHRLHKLCLEVFAHNAAAVALYRKCGFVEEGRRARQYRRDSGELWDTIVMGRALQSAEHEVEFAGREAGAEGPVTDVAAQQGPDHRPGLLFRGTGRTAPERKRHTPLVSARAAVARKA